MVTRKEIEDEQAYDEAFALVEENMKRRALEDVAKEHSDKGYEVGTHEKQAEFEKKRNQNNEGE